MLFFQALLLAGYGYAHLSIRYLRPGVQACVHLGLLAAAAVVLVVTPAESWQPGAAEVPIVHILGVLVISIALPYLALASTSPLLQAWFARMRQGRSPYRFYALSNAGSLLGLMSYPFVVEPLLSRHTQLRFWSWGWVAFAAMSAVCAVIAWRASPRVQPRQTPTKKVDAPLTSVSLRLLWAGLAGGAVVVMLAVTNKICLDLAAIPFLWVLPLSLYLASFIICFAGEKWYPRRMFLVLFILAMTAVIYLRTQTAHVPLRLQIVLYLSTMFACCMVCHGELFRQRPPAAQVTYYYLTIAAGGTLGGFFVAVIAPLIFNTYVDLYLGLLGCCLLALLADKTPSLRRRRWLWVVPIVLVSAAAVVMEERTPKPTERVVQRERNFYGILTLWENDFQNTTRHRYVMQHGTTLHGLQFTHTGQRNWPTTYYGEDSGVGLTLRHLPREGGLRVGVIGLGVGTLATYAQAGDAYRFYEINPLVRDWAQERFTYLSDSAGSVEVIMGDARLSLRRENPQQFDVLVLDAFSSDAIPVHLLTREAFEIYLKNLRDDGVLAAHVSTHYLELESVVLKLGEYFGMEAAWIRSAENPDKGLLSANWVLLTRNRGFLEQTPIRKAARPVLEDFRKTRLWTDDQVSLLDVLR